MRRYLLAVVLLSFAFISFGQENEKPVTVVDDIQIDVKGVQLSAKGDTATVELFLISYQKNPREFKLNTFASGVVDSEGSPYLYASVQMGNVMVKIEDRQNYIHYFMEQDVPVLLTVKTSSWTKRWGKPQQAKLVFEDSTEPGKFLEVMISLSEPNLP